MLAVICVQIHLLDLAHKRITRVSTRALIVERLFYHLVKSVKEVLFVYAVILDGILDTDIFLEVIYCFYKIFEFFFIIISAKSQIFSKIVLKQVIKRILPPMSNEIITLIKDTALANVILVGEIINREKLFHSFFVLLLAKLVVAIGGCF